MKVVVASDSFKGSLTSLQVADAVRRGILRASDDIPSGDQRLAGHRVVAVPVADGGEGTVDAILSQPGWRRVACTVTGPYGGPVTAAYAVDGRGNAFIEVAQAVGLAQRGNRRDVANATSAGVGQLMRHAIGQGCRHLTVGLGGSATSDGGLGMLIGLGAVCDSDSLLTVRHIDASPALSLLDGVDITVAADVDNPFCGPRGAACVFAPQKGADADTVALLDGALRRLAAIYHDATGIDVTDLPGAGAAGGLGGALVAFGRASMCSGIDTVLNAMHFDGLVNDAYVVITGEGRMDLQTLAGKAPLGVLRAVRRVNPSARVIAVAGSVDGRALPRLLDAGFTAILPVTPPDMPLQQAMDSETASLNISNAVARYFMEPKKHLRC